MIGVSGWQRRARKGYSAVNDLLEHNAISVISLFAGLILSS
jgi:hypothetical protein